MGGEAGGEEEKRDDGRGLWCARGVRGCVSVCFVCAWWSVVVYGGVWWCVVVCGGLWWSVVVSCGVCGGVWCEVV